MASTLICSIFRRKNTFPVRNEIIDPEGIIVSEGVIEREEIIDRVITSLVVYIRFLTAFYILQLYII